MTYLRPPGAGQADYQAARAMEEYVGQHLPDKIERLDSNEYMDWFIPGCWLDLKEKKQRIGDRWELPCPEIDAFILDEVAVRKALPHYPAAYFLLHDCPQDRWFLASIAELVCCDRVRMNRVLEKSVRGKWIVDMTQFTYVSNLDDIYPMMVDDQVKIKWKNTECLIGAGDV